MSKRRMTEDRTEYIATPVKSITAAQLEALKDAKSSLPHNLESLSPLLEEILAAYESTIPPHKTPVRTRAATDFKSTSQAARFLNVDYDHDSPSYGLHIKNIEYETRELSLHYGAVISDLRSNKYILDRTDENFSRTILDLILVDRLNNLQDKDAYHKLLLSAEVSVSVKVDDEFGERTIVKGRADWALGYGSSKSHTGSLLIIVEAKHIDNVSIGMPQMLVYMTAIHEARRDRNNKTVWGLLSDGSTFHFACLNDDRKLLTSRPLIWRDDKSVILRHIDTILIDAIQSSPHTTPIKVKNPNIRAYRRYLSGSWKFGEESEDEGDEQDDGEDAYVDVIKRDGHVFLRSKAAVFE